MNATCDLPATTVTQGTRCEPRPTRAIPWATVETELEKLKTRSVRRALNGIASADADSFIRRAANDAAALAWDTHFPLLLFPTLFEEKARTSLAQMRMQASVRRRSQELVLAPAELSGT